MTSSSSLDVRLPIGGRFTALGLLSEHQPWLGPCDAAVRGAVVGVADRARVARATAHTEPRGRVSARARAVNARRLTGSPESGTMLCDVPAGRPVSRMRPGAPHPSRSPLYVVRCARSRNSRGFGGCRYDLELAFSSTHVPLPLHHPGGHMSAHSFRGSNIVSCRAGR